MHILVTRPKHQSEKLIQALEVAGHQVSAVPLLEIHPTVFDSEEQASMLSQLKSADKIIVVSANAALSALAILEKMDREEVCPIYAIGPSTAKVIENKGFDVRIPEGDYNSESLLDLTDFQQISDQSIVILCGLGGRDYLEEQLYIRQSKVIRMELYSRARSRNPQTLLDDIPKPDVAIAMSGDTVEAFSAALKGVKDDWQDLPLLVPGKRVEAIAIATGFTKVIAAEKPTTESLLDVLSGLSEAV